MDISKLSHSDVAELSARAAEATAERVNLLQSELDARESEISSLNCKLTSEKKKVISLEAENEVLERTAENADDVRKKTEKALCDVWLIHSSLMPRPDRTTLSKAPKDLSAAEKKLKEFLDEDSCEVPDSNRLSRLSAHIMHVLNLQLTGSRLK